MASELAMSAVHNGRFHHATASLALEEQLATRRSLMMENQRSCNPMMMPSCKFPTPFKARPVVRSASSSVFSQVPSLGGESAFTDELSKVDSAFSEGEFYDSQASNNNSSRGCAPSMVQSSQSDNSLDGDDAEDCSFASDSPEDCAGQWAAALVTMADQSMDKESATLLFARDRSTSESSDSSSGSDGSSSSTSTDALSKSPVGFWYVRPGSSSIEDTSVDYNDESICWTPSLQSSSHPSPAADTFSLNNNEGLGCPPHILSPSGFSTSNLSKLLTESSGEAAGVGFAATAALDELSHPSNNTDDEFGPITPIMAVQPTVPPVTLGSLSSFKPMKKMSRSISYSAFSTYSTGITLPKTESKPKLFQSTHVRTSLSSTQENDLFRTYFMKFVDLLVVRETERLVNSKAKA